MSEIEQTLGLRIKRFTEDQGSRKRVSAGVKRLRPSRTEEMNMTTEALTAATAWKEHRDETIEKYMNEQRMTRKQAEAHYQWAFPRLSSEEMHAAHARLDRGILIGPFDSLTDDGADWFVAGEDFIAQELEPRAVYLSDKESGATVFYQASLNQIFATRGLGKSIVTNALLKCLIGGSNFLRLTSTGGLNVLLVDGELPPIQLQERLKEFGETGQLTLLTRI